MNYLIQFILLVGIGIGPSVPILELLITGSYINYTYFCIHIKKIDFLL